MAADDVVKIAIGALMVGAVAFFVRIQIALIREFVHSPRATRWMGLPRFNRVIFQGSHFVVHERAEVVVIAPDARQPRIPWPGRERGAAMALAAWGIGRHLER